MTHTVNEARNVCVHFIIDRTSTVYDFMNFCKMWHDQGKWVTCRKCKFLISYTTFSKLQNASFWCNPVTIGYLVTELWRIWQCLKQYVTKEFEHCFCQYLKYNIPNNTSDSFLLIMSQICHPILKGIVMKIDIRKILMSQSQHCLFVKVQACKIFWVNSYSTDNSLYVEIKGGWTVKLPGSWNFNF